MDKSNYFDPTGPDGTNGRLITFPNRNERIRNDGALFRDVGREHDDDPTGHVDDRRLLLLK